MEALAGFATAYALCKAGGCKSPECVGRESLRIAAIDLVRDMLDKIANRRAITPAQGHKASADAMRAVADELAIVVSELASETRLKLDVMTGKAAKC